jgi:hypothetical protein
VNKVQVFVTFWLLGTVLLLLVPLHWLQDVLEYIEGMREYDVPYHVRFAIDTGNTWHCGAADMPVCVLTEPADTSSSLGDFQC